MLLVEDLEHNRELAKKILSDAGHAVDTATNGAEALAAIQNANNDIVLMDIQMPVMDGVTATRFIRQLDHRAANIPIIAMSANACPTRCDVTGVRGSAITSASPETVGNTRGAEQLARENPQTGPHQWEEAGCLK